MQLMMLKSKIHRARVTRVELDYEGSCAVDGALLDAAGIREYEQIQIYNITSGDRFTTYAIRATDGSGIISVNGAAAHRASRDDRVIICAYAQLDERELERYKPRLIYVNDTNEIVRTAGHIPVQVA